MALTRPAPLSDTPAPPTRPANEIAKAAIRRLAQEQVEPTPENYARAYDEEIGRVPRSVLPARARSLIDKLAADAFETDDAANQWVAAFAEARWRDGEALLRTRGEQTAARARSLAAIVGRLVRGLETSGRQWTLARKKDSVQRVLEGSGGDLGRLQQRLGQLVASWDGDDPDSLANEAVEAAAAAPVGDPPAVPSVSTASVAAPAALPQSATADPLAGALATPTLTPTPTPTPTPVQSPVPVTVTVTSAAAAAASPLSTAWHPALGALGQALGTGLSDDDARGEALAQALQSDLARLQSEGPGPAVNDAVRRDCEQAQHWLHQRRQLLREAQALCGEFTESLVDLAEDDSWAQGQCAALRARLGEDFNARGLRAAGELLRATRERQRRVGSERALARDALKGLIAQMLQELNELGSQTGRFHDHVARHAATIEQADSLESLAGAVRELVSESRSVQQIVSQTQARLQSEHRRASDLTDRVASLEGELRRLSDEVATDPLTQVANRRGLTMAFDAVCAQDGADGRPLAVALLDVDNFKRLNDELGHAAGDVALKALAEQVSKTLRPTDRVARYGGEEFVVLLPDTPLDEALQVLGRTQRALTQALFMHESRPVFVTFSAGLTAHVPGEALDDALERADAALYEAKRTGKNRTCVSDARTAGSC